MRYHPVSEIFPMMADAEIRDLAADIAEHGQREPIWVHQDGSIIDGRNRYRACKVAGVEPETIQYNDPDETLVPFVISLNLKRRHLDTSQRAMVAARIATLDKGSNQHAQNCAPSQGSAAEVLNVSRRAVQQAKKVQQDGAPELAEAVDRGVVSVDAASEVAALPRNRQEELVARGEKEIIAAAKEIRERRKALGMEALQSSESNEWYTPDEFFEAARYAMGEIDLDPASCKMANERIRAGEYFTIEEDGFSKPWFGRVWLNPPYGRDTETNESNQGRWSDKLRQEFLSGDVDQAVLLVNAVTDRKWFEQLWEFPICFVYGRIKFDSPEGKAPSPTHGSVLVGFGVDESLFLEAFADLGRCVFPSGDKSVSRVADETPF